MIFNSNDWKAFNETVSVLTEIPREGILDKGKNSNLS